MKGNLSISQLNNYISGVIEDELILNNISVFGEVMDCSLSGGNVYFTLTDGKSRISCVRFGDNRKTDLNGEVLVRATVKYYAKGGRLTLVVKSVEPYGKGRQMLMLVALKEKLLSEGLFENRPKPKLFIERVAVITSGTGAVIHDIIKVLSRRHGYIDLKLFAVKVQGAGADKEILAALEAVNSSKEHFDAIVLARGGGSSGDLNTFNSETLARAVAASAVPVISAIGHEVDYTLCDFCAGLRAGTPSIAAERICAINDAGLDKMYAYIAKIKQKCLAKYSEYSLKMQNFINGMTYKSQALYYKGYSRLRAVSRKMHDAVCYRVDAGKIKLNVAARGLSAAALACEERGRNRHRRAVIVLDSLSPLKLMAGGYSRATVRGKSVKSVSDVAVGDELSISVCDGLIVAQVKNKEKVNGL